MLPAEKAAFALVLSSSTYKYMMSLFIKRKKTTQLTCDTINENYGNDADDENIYNLKLNKLKETRQNP